MMMVMMVTGVNGGHGCDRDGDGDGDEMISKGQHLMRKYGTKSTTATCPRIFRAGGGPSKTNTSSTFRENSDSNKVHHLKHQTCCPFVIHRKFLLTTGM